MIANPKSSTLLMSANATSQNVALPGGGGLLLEVFNRGPQDAYFETTSDANMPATVPTASVAGSRLIAANQPAVIAEMRATDTRFVAVSGGNSTITFTRGQAIG